MVDVVAVRVSVSKLASGLEQSLAGWSFSPVSSLASLLQGLLLSSDTVIPSKSDIGLKDGEGDDESESLLSRMIAGGEEPKQGVCCVHNWYIIYELLLINHVSIPSQDKLIW